MKSTFEDKIILVTGGCGSIGSEIVRQLLKFNPKAIRVFDNNSSTVYTLPGVIVPLTDYTQQHCCFTNKR